MKKVLIVEDSLPIVALHKNIAIKAGLEPVIAMTFSEVKALSSQFDDFFCAIIDYSLPDAPNGEAIDFILDAKVPSIVMTGMLDDNIREHILGLPVIDYITKESKQAFHYLLSLLKKLQTNNKIKILVVDDSGSARAYVRGLLLRHNFDVLLANSGKSALNVLKNNPDIKLIITDKEMPNMNGIELCNEIRATHTKDDVSIIGISANSSQSLTAKFIKNGANDFLQKPFCLEEFYCRVIQNIEYIQSIDTIRKQANTDYLTDLANRRYYFNSAQPIMDSLDTSTVAMMDIDDFKSINDNYGHDAGDIVLKTISSLIKLHFEPKYLAARLGGEEFSIYFHDLELEKAVNMLENFRQELEKTKINVGSELISCTVSIGVCQDKKDKLDSLLILADQKLYSAKETGKNKVVF
ncbi:diguanylate cyclase [Psychrosphaera haliotis]|uniref:diguanylate cyclase n=1 Tax=Psychrosphaera haliotis TaxID=555083 RepID=A0A6N8F930_9GAMM|nr:diguanylate cyclase [Psychrosphaera haliotis]MUH72758.1 diguanylate cyclase [Psychrosphaera haliotis]